MALHRRQELWQLRDARDQALHILLSGSSRDFALQEWLMEGGTRREEDGSEKNQEVGSRRSRGTGRGVGDVFRMISREANRGRR